uniref:Uncharacterized protein n=1 Tax=Ceratitis capitata TaxID=7213 RepID=W8CAP0_CERCA
MALFEMKWLRRWVRRHTSPIPEDNAVLWKRRLSVVYALLAWNAFGFVCYMVYTGRNDWARYYGFKSEEEAKLTPAQQFATQLNVDKGKIIRFSGFKRMGEVEFDNTSGKAE